MKITSKPITLRQDTYLSIKEGNIDTNTYVDYIRTHLDAANFLIQAKIISLDEIELFEAMSKVFDLELSQSDILKILGDKYGKHFLGFKEVKTNMVDSDGNNIVLVGAYTKRVMQEYSVMPTKTLRNLVNPYDFVVVDVKRVTYSSPLSKPDSYEDYKFESPSTVFDNQDGLLEYKLSLLAKEVKDKSTLKRILALLEEYVRELVFQAKAVIRLDDDDESLKPVCAEFRKAYDSNFTKKEVFKKGKHKKRY